MESSLLPEQLATEQVSSGVTSTLTDLGAALVFGLGFYFFKSHFKKGKDDKDIKDKMKPFREKIADTINKWESSISLQKINSMIKEEVSDKNFNPFTVLDQMQKNNLSPDITIVNTLLDTTLRLKDFNNFKRLSELVCVEKGSESLPLPNIITYNILIKGISYEMEKGNFSLKDSVKAKVDRIHDHLVAGGIKPNEITVNSTIDIMIESGNFDEAWRYYDEMESKYELQPDIYTYSTLIKSIKNYQPDPKNIERAFNILKMIKLSQTRGIKPDEVLYNSIIDTCIKYNRIKQAEALFEDMKEAQVTPSRITYAIMIKAYGNDYNFDKSLAIFAEMQNAGIAPNEISYGSLLNAAVKCNKIDKVLLIYEEIQAANITMNIFHYSSLIKAFSRAKDFNKAFNIWEKLNNDPNLSPNTVTYNAILDCCVECGDFLMMNKIYEGFKEKAYESDSGVLPDLITYSTVIKGYGKMKNVEKVIDIYNFLKGRNEFVLDEVMYNTIIDSLHKAEKYEIALQIYEDMLKAGVTRSNATYSIIIKVYSKLNMVKKAVEIYNEMLDRGIKPSFITYTAIIQILVKSKMIQNAIDIFDEIIQNELTPDQVIYNVIVNGCVYNGRLSDACRFLFRSFLVNLRLCDDVYKNVLINLLTNRTMDFSNKCETTLKICKELKDRNIQIDYELYYKVMKMVYKNSGKKCETIAKKETEEYKSVIETKSLQRPKYYNNRK